MGMLECLHDTKLSSQTREIISIKLSFVDGFDRELILSRLVFSLEYRTISSSAKYLLLIEVIDIAKIFVSGLKFDIVKSWIVIHIIAAAETTHYNIFL